MQSDATRVSVVSPYAGELAVGPQRRSQRDRILAELIAARGGEVPAPRVAAISLHTVRALANCAAWDS